MARSTTVWAAALVLASFSGSGPLLTTAEAMPAPGPQETQGRPRYYFPRHVKRQIVTNTTAPAAPTSSPPVVLSSTSSEQLESRQVPNRASSFLESLFGNRPGSSSNVLGSKSESELTSTVTSVQEIIVTPVPDSSERRPDGTGNLRPTPSSDPVNVRPPPPSSSAPSSAPTQPEQEPEPVPAPPSSSSIARASPNNPLLGTGSLPLIVAPSASPTPSPSSRQPEVVAPPSPAVDPSSGIPSEIVRPTSSSQPNLLSSLLGGVGASTGVLPSSVVQPTPSPESPSSSFLGPFIVPGSSGSPSSVVVQPTPSQNFLGGLLSSVLGTPEATPSPQVGSTGVLPSSIVIPTSAAAAVPSSDTPLIVLPSSGGIVVGITTALGTGAPTPSPVLSSGAIPTSEAASPSAPPLNLPSILSSLVSEVSGVLPSGSAGPTAPTTPSPAPTPSGVLPPLVSSLVADVSSLLSSAVPELSASALPSIASSIVLESPLPSATGPIIPPASSLVSSLLSEISSGIVPTASAAIPTPDTSLPVPSETLSVTPSPPASASVTPSASDVVPGITPSASLSPTGSVGSGILPTPTPSESGSITIPASEGPVSSGLPSNTPIVGSSAGNATASEAPATSVPVSSADSATIPIPTTPTPTASPVQSQKPIGSDSATSMIIPSIIIQESTSNAAPSPTSSGIPSALPRVIAPPGGMPTDVSTQDTFLGQVCFKWQLNYPFVAQKDGGNQIFHYLPKAIADGLNISQSEVRNMGLRPLDTTQYQGFITTLAYFTIPKDLQSKLQAQLRNPADPFWHNKDQTVNDLTNLINTACPLAGRPSPDSANPNQGANPAGTPTGGPGDGGALGGNIGASRPINGSAAGIATGAIVGAIAYGAAMFFVARRYRNKRIAHQRSSSVPSTGSRMTYGSIPGGAAAWMHGARNGRITPGSRGSRGSSSSQGRSVRTQQISAPVMAENSLGWN